MCIITKQDWIETFDKVDLPGVWNVAAWDELIVRKRWPDGVTCPYCFCKKIYYLNRPFYYSCAACRKKFSNTTGTIFWNNNIEHTHLITWAFEYLDNTEISPKFFQHNWEVTYVTAWKNLKKIKEHTNAEGLHFLAADKVNRSIGQLKVA